MTDSNDQDQKKVLHLNSGAGKGKLESKKPVETQVRQSFSHGRSKPVTVEVKRKRHVEKGAVPGVADTDRSPFVNIDSTTVAGIQRAARADGRKLGPLAGILAGMEWAAAHHPHAGWILTAPADVPFLPLDLVARVGRLIKLRGARPRHIDLRSAVAGSAIRAEMPGAQMRRLI